MKWKKFREKLAQHPFLSKDLNWRGVLRDSREFVRTKLGFIAFRPFESLDLSAGHSSSSTPLKSDYANVPMESYTATEYQLCFHVEGDGELTRGRFVTTDVGDGSIQAHIDDVTRWFKSCEAFRGKRLIWERVVKRMVSGSSHTGLTTMNLEIYLFPEFSCLKHPLQTSPALQKDLDPLGAARAYVCGESMPPIIPA